MLHTVLVVDDEPEVTNGLRHALFQENYGIVTANSAQEALEVLGREPVDVVVSDEKMPGMSGSELLAIVRKEYPDTVRIILTGQASLEAAVRGINEGEIYRFLMKPCNGTDLVVTIQQALQHKKLMTESKKLLELARQQAKLIEEMETKYPGITEVKRDAQGAIIIDDSTEDVDDLIQEIKTEVNKTEKFFSDWVCQDVVDE